MPDDFDAFKEYYQQSFRSPKGKQKVKKEEPRNFDEQVSMDADTIKATINSYIKRINAIIGETVEAEKKKGTRADLIITIVVGGLAFTLANVFMLVTRNLKSKMSESEYEDTFVGMWRSAVKDMKEKDEEEGG